MKSADNMVKMKACKKATNNFNIKRNNDIGIDSPAHAALPNVNIIPVNDNIIMCPAVIFANKRTIKANGLANIPIISTGIIIGNKAIGTPGVEKICFQ